MHTVEDPRPQSKYRTDWLSQTLYLFWISIDILGNWVYKIHFCENSCLALCLPVQHLAHSGWWCSLGCLVRLTDDIVHSLLYMSVHGLVTPCPSLMTHTHTHTHTGHFFAHFFVCFPRNGRSVSHGLRTHEVSRAPPGCPPQRSHWPPPHHQPRRETVLVWLTRLQEDGSAIDLLSGGQGDADVSIRVSTLCAQPLPKYR